MTAPRAPAPSSPQDSHSAERPWHLAASDAERVMAEFEHALICLGEAFGRYNLQGLAGASGDTSFSGTATLTTGMPARESIYALNSSEST